MSKPHLHVVAHGKENAKDANATKTPNVKNTAASQTAAPASKAPAQASAQAKTADAQKTQNTTPPAAASKPTTPAAKSVEQPKATVTAKPQTTANAKTSAPTPSANQAATSAVAQTADAVNKVGDALKGQFAAQKNLVNSATSTANSIARGVSVSATEFKNANMESAKNMLASLEQINPLFGFQMQMMRMMFAPWKAFLPSSLWTEKN